MSSTTGFVFVLDVSVPMNNLSICGSSCFDMSICFVSQMINKLTDNDLMDQSVQITIVTSDLQVLCIEETIKVALDVISNIRAIGGYDLVGALKIAFELINLGRLFRKTDNYGEGMLPFCPEVTLITILTNRKFIFDCDEEDCDSWLCQNMSSRDIPGMELCELPCRWDQVIALVFFPTLSDMEDLKFSLNAMAEDNQKTGFLAEIVKGRMTGLRLKGFIVTSYEQIASRMDTWLFELVMIERRKVFVGGPVSIVKSSWVTLNAECFIVDETERLIMQIYPIVLMKDEEGMNRRAYKWPFPEPSSPVVQQLAKLEPRLGNVWLRYCLEKHDFSTDDYKHLFEIGDHYQFTHSAFYELLQATRSDRTSVWNVYMRNTDGSSDGQRPFAILIPHAKHLNVVSFINLPYDFINLLKLTKTHNLGNEFLSSQSDNFNSVSQIIMSQYIDKIPPYYLKVFTELSNEMVIASVVVACIKNKRQHPSLIPVNIKTYLESCSSNARMLLEHSQSKARSFFAVKASSGSSSNTRFQLNGSSILRDKYKSFREIIEVAVSVNKRLNLNCLKTGFATQQNIFRTRVSTKNPGSISSPLREINPSNQFCEPFGNPYKPIVTHEAEQGNSLASVLANRRENVRKLKTMSFSETLDYLCQWRESLNSEVNVLNVPFIDESSQSFEHDTSAFDPPCAEILESRVDDEEDEIETKEKFQEESDVTEVNDELQKGEKKYISKFSFKSLDDLSFEDFSGGGGRTIFEYAKDLLKANGDFDEMADLARGFLETDEVLLNKRFEVSRKCIELIRRKLRNAGNCDRKIERLFNRAMEAIKAEQLPRRHVLSILIDLDISQRFLFLFIIRNLSLLIF
ncbi:hypothetical protein ACOME3_007331 [Neoechinorhynchus agilis]